MNRSSRSSEAADQLFGVVVEEKPQILVVGSPLQRDHAEVLVVGDRAVDELHLGARLAFVVEDQLLAVRDVDERLAHVVLRDELTRLLRDAEAEQPRAGVRGDEADPYRRRLAVGRELDLLRSDDAAFVLDVDRDGLAGIAGLGHDRVDDERGPLERRARRRDSIDLDVAGEAVAADADGEDRHRRRLS